MLTFFKGTADTKSTADPKGKLWIILIVAAVGITLILIGGMPNTNTEEELQAPYSTESDELVIYQKYLEGQIKSLCESVRGVGNVTVTVTLSGGFESVYATEWKDGNEEYVILGSGASASPIFLSRAAPEIAGIGIVCNGGENEYVKYELIGLLSAAFHVNSNRIYVTKARS